MGAPIPKIPPDRQLSSSKPEKSILLARGTQHSKQRFDAQDVSQFILSHVLLATLQPDTTEHCDERVL